MIIPAKQAVAYFEQGFYCSQAVLAAHAPELGLDRDSALKIAAAFGAGIARTGRTCGAVTGALMAIGLKHGRTAAGDIAAKARTDQLAGQFLAEFQARHGALDCRELLGHDIGTPAGLEQARAEGLFTTLCTRLVREAAEILGPLLE
jgi:C_GCAxxG_C_C family probable redox protein